MESTQESVIYPSLAGRHVLISGGASGIGAALVNAFAQNHCRVSFFDIDDESGIEVEQTLQAQGHQVHFSHVDLMVAESLADVIASRMAQWGSIRVLVNNAANDQRHTLQTLNSEQFDQCIAVNLKHHFFAAQAVAPEMANAGGGSIINMGSNSWLLGLTGYPAYVTAKAGVSGLTKGLARELGAQKIRVNSVVPGWVMTDKQKNLWLTPELEKDLMSQQALKEQITPQDVADMVLFLASDNSRMISGQSFIIDGGRV